MKDYFYNTYLGVYIFFYIIGCLSTIGDMVYYGNEGMVGTAILYLVFFWAVAFFKAIIPTLVWGSLISLIGALPYYIYLRIKRNKTLKTEADKLY